MRRPVRVERAGRSRERKGITAMRNRTSLFALIGLFVVAGFGLGCGREKSNVVARVNQQPITQRQLWQALEQSDNGEAGRRTLDSLIVRQLIRQEAQKRDITVSREELEARIEALKDYVLAATGKDFDTWLEETGQTEEDLANRISVQILTAKLVLPEDEREKFFEENKERLQTLPHNNESVIYRQTIVPSKEEAEAVYEELQAQSEDGKVSGETFAKVAEERTLDPVQQQRGGMAGWLINGSSGDPELEAALFDLEPGVVSKPIPVSPPPSAEEEEETPQRPHFYRIVMVEKKVTPGELTLARNADVIEEWMLNDPRFQRQLQEFFSNLRAKADIEILSPRYRAIEEAYRESREARERRLSQEKGDLRPGVPAPAGEAPSPPPEAPEPGSE
jgi:parvulin-like peptidyl-prolyl isomerase